MAKKEKNSTSKKYLKVLGVLSIIFAVISVITGIITIAIQSQFTLADIGMADIMKSMPAEATEEMVKIIFGSTIIFAGLMELLIGCLLIRAANNPRKSTFLLVLLVIQVISCAFTLFSSGFTSVASAFGNILNLTIYVLALAAVFKIRGEIDN